MTTATCSDVGMDNTRTPSPETPVSFDEEALILAMLGELHANVPEADRPMSMSDLSDEQAERARKAVNRVLVLSMLSKPAGRFASIAEAEAALAETPVSGSRLWLWRNFVDGRPEYWAFDNPYPCEEGGGDPLTLGKPCGWAIFKPSENARPDVSAAAVEAEIVTPSADVSSLIEVVARAICFEDGPHGCGCVEQCKSDQFPADDIFMRYARAAIAAYDTETATVLKRYREALEVAANALDDVWADVKLGQRSGPTVSNARHKARAALKAGADPE
jgi:hypothetical protein